MRSDCFSSLGVMSSTITVLPIRVGKTTCNRPSKTFLSRPMISIRDLADRSLIDGSGPS